MRAPAEERCKLSCTFYLEMGYVANTNQLHSCCHFGLIHLSVAPASVPAKRALSGSCRACTVLTPLHGGKDKSLKPTRALWDRQKLVDSASTLL